MNPQPDKPALDTLCARPTPVPPSATTPVVPPIELSVVYQVAHLDQVDALYEGVEHGHIYARDSHPGAERLASKLATLEGAQAGLICGSGMGAEAAFFLACAQAGDRLALAEGLYGKTQRLARFYLGRLGIDTAHFDPTRPESLRGVLTPTTRVVFVETLSNPLMRVADFEGLAEVIRSAGSEALLVSDNTFAPCICRPLEHGAVAVTHSLTKLIGGHSDVTLGLLAGSADLVREAGAVSSAFGMNGSPFDCWLTLRGVATLPLRSNRACATALELAARLERELGEGRVHYPGLKSHPDHARADRLLRGGYGTIVTIDLGDRARADAFIRAQAHIPFAPSLGDVATTLSHPATTSHRGQTAEDWASQGITPGLVRISLGLEDPADLWKEIHAALRRVHS